MLTFKFMFEPTWLRGVGGQIVFIGRLSRQGLLQNSQREETRKQTTYGNGVHGGRDEGCNRGNMEIKKKYYVIVPPVLRLSSLQVRRTVVWAFVSLSPTTTFPKWWVVRDVYFRQLARLSFASTTMVSPLVGWYPSIANVFHSVSKLPVLRGYSTPIFANSRLSPLRRQW